MHPPVMPLPTSGARAGAPRAARDPLLTHVLTLEPGVRHLNHIIGDRTRTVAGELVIRLVIDLGGAVGVSRA
ncbi:hypothetical protein ACVNF4_07255 [Streptomyces sp. S6]